MLSGCDTTTPHAPFLGIGRNVPCHIKIHMKFACKRCRIVDTLGFLNSLPSAFGADVIPLHHAPPGLSSEPVRGQPLCMTSRNSVCNAPVKKPPNQMPQKWPILSSKIGDIKITSTSTEKQKRSQNLAPVLVIISGISLVFSVKIFTSTGFYRCCQQIEDHPHPQ